MKVYECCGVPLEPLKAGEHWQVRCPKCQRTTEASSLHEAAATHPRPGHRPAQMRLANATLELGGPHYGTATYASGAMLTLARGKLRLDAYGTAVAVSLLPHERAELALALLESLPPRLPRPEALTEILREIATQYGGEQ